MVGFVNEDRRLTGPVSWCRRLVGDAALGSPVQERPNFTVPPIAVRQPCIDVALVHRRQARTALFNPGKELERDAHLVAD